MTSQPGPTSPIGSIGWPESWTPRRLRTAAGRRDCKASMCAAGSGSRFWRPSRNPQPDSLLASGRSRWALPSPIDHSPNAVWKSCRAAASASSRPSVAARSTRASRHRVGRSAAARGRSQCAQSGTRVGAIRGGEIGPDRCTGGARLFRGRRQGGWRSRRETLRQEAAKGLKGGIPNKYEWFPFERLPAVRWRGDDTPVAPGCLLADRLGLEIEIGRT